ncbi:protein kinase domain-containing protein [Vibrio mediterranei]|uniref:protein kinase domain-containing protein n=1 Tax=Vibrio mediterranei TaxID=689 RepID=UPI002284EF67|nr:protein kinase [Vibrio mediterranei]MCY9854742.1 protein kinase [Vibrio mediterranei]
MNSKKRNTVFDKHGNAYELVEKIGEGGQGVVCKTQLSGILVKILNTKNENAIQKWKSQLEWSLRQDLTGLNLAHPKIQITRPRLGYVMELMDGLIPLQQVLEKSFSDLVDNQSIEQYIKTGGLKRRLHILLKVAKTLAKLHGRGYAYGDISPANIFVSEDSRYSEVWFIDCDNLCVDEREGFTHIHTPGYGAPEVVRGDIGVNALTDQWSFAVMAFELLTHQHPFMGLEVEDGEAEVVEQQAYEGRLPWVYDSEDDCNESTGGIDLSLVSNEALYNLFDRCFTKGKTHPYERPSLGAWCVSLQEALDHLLECPSCKSHYFVDFSTDEQACPFCSVVVDKEHYAVLKQVIYLNEEELRETPNVSDGFVDTNNLRIVSNGTSLNFKSAPYNTELWFESEDDLTVTMSNGDIYLVPENHAVCNISRKNTSQVHQIKHKQRIAAERRSAIDPYEFTTWRKSEEHDASYVNLLSAYRWQLV